MVRLCLGTSWHQSSTDSTPWPHTTLSAPEGPGKRDLVNMSEELQNMSAMGGLIWWPLCNMQAINNATRKEQKGLYVLSQDLAKL